MKLGRLRVTCKSASVIIRSGMIEKTSDEKITGTEPEPYSESF